MSTSCELATHMRHWQLPVVKDVRGSGQPLFSPPSKISTAGRRGAVTLGRRGRKAEKHPHEGQDRRYSYHYPRTAPRKQGALHHRVDHDKGKRKTEKRTSPRKAALLNTVHAVQEQHRRKEGRRNIELRAMCGGGRHTCCSDL